MNDQSPSNQNQTIYNNYEIKEDRAELKNQKQ